MKQNKIVRMPSKSGQSSHDSRLQYEVEENGRKIKVFKVHPMGTRAFRRKWLR